MFLPIPFPEGEQIFPPDPAFTAGLLASVFQVAFSHPILNGIQPHDKRLRGLLDRVIKLIHRFGAGCAHGLLSPPPPEIGRFGFCNGAQCVTLQPS